MTRPAINTHGLRISVGRHAGELYTRLPVSYLRWMLSCRHEEASLAEAELERRGTTIPELEVTGHAIDRASLTCWHVYLATRQDAQEGLNHWLCRTAALAHATPPPNPDKPDRRTWGDLTLCFEETAVWPVLKTIFNRSPDFVKARRKARKHYRATHPQARTDACPPQSHAPNPAP